MIRPSLRNLRFYRTLNGTEPALTWLLSLPDKLFQTQINARFRRIGEGHFGDYKPLGRALFEMRVFLGPGYRIYFGLDGIKQEIILLYGGTKTTQKKDIRKAKTYWKDYRERCYGKN